MNAPTPLVSVIIPAYNAARDLPATLESLLAQTFRDWEAIVVDDGSRDDTCAIVERYALRDPRIRLIRQINGGTGAARNTAIAAARAAYLAPLDADDVWAPDKLQRQVERMEQGPAALGMVYCWSTRIDPQGRVLSPGFAARVEGDIHRAVVLRNLIGNASTPLLRASAVRAVGGYLTRAQQGGFQGCEDWDLYLRIAERFQVAVVPAYLVGYRQTESCLSARAGLMSGSYRYVLRQAQARNPALPRRLVRWSAGHFYVYLASKSYACSQYLDCWQSIGRAVLADPLVLLNPKLSRFLACGLVHALTGNVIRRRRPAFFWSTQPPGASPWNQVPPPERGPGLYGLIQYRRWLDVSRPGEPGSATQPVVAQRSVA